MNQVRTLAILAILILFQGCVGNKKSIEGLDFPEHIFFRSEDEHGNRSEEKIKRTDPRAGLIETYLKQGAEGLSASWDTFVPCFEFRATNFLINVRSDFIVANIKSTIHIDGVFFIITNTLSL